MHPDTNNHEDELALWVPLSDPPATVLVAHLAEERDADGRAVPSTGTEVSEPLPSTRSSPVAVAGAVGE